VSAGGGRRWVHLCANDACDVFDGDIGVDLLETEHLGVECVAVHRRSIALVAPCAGVEIIYIMGGYLNQT